MKGSGIQPGHAPVEDADMQLAAVQVLAVDIGNFVFAPGGRFEVLGDGDNFIVVKIEPGHGVVGFGLRRLFLNGDGATVFVEFHDAIAFRIVDGRGKDHSAIRVGVRADELAEARAVENVVSENQGYLIETNKLLADDKGLREAVGNSLFRVTEITPELGAVAEQPLKIR